MRQWTRNYLLRSRCAQLTRHLVNREEQGRMIAQTSGAISMINESNYINDVPIFAYPHNIGHNNVTVITTVAKYYQLGRTGDRPLAFLNCDLSLENENNGSINQTNYLNGNCSRHVSTEIPNNYNNDNYNNSKVVSSTYYDKLLKINKYSVSIWTHHPHHLNRLYNSSQMFQQFIQEVNSQDKYNHGGIINTIPIITYHNFTNITNMNYVRNKYSTDTNLFAREMKFLHDNHFIVLPMSDIRYNEYQIFVCQQSK